MTTLAGVFVALGLVTAAWIGRIVAPTQGASAGANAPSLAGWVFGLVVTVVLLLVALGVMAVR